MLRVLMLCDSFLAKNISTNNIKVQNITFFKFIKAMVALINYPIKKLNHTGYKKCDYI